MTVIDPLDEPTPDEAAGALRAVRAGQERTIRSAIDAPWVSIAGGLVVFGYSTVDDLIPAVRPWLTWVLLAILLVLVVGLRTRAGSSLLGRPVALSSRGLPMNLKWRLLRDGPIIAVALVVALVVRLLDLPHGAIYYGALAGAFIIFVGPRLRLWVLLRRLDEG